MYYHRPAYMDEYEKLEEELQLCYDDYMQKFRNQAYLENILDEYHRAQLDENEVAVFVCSLPERRSATVKSHHSEDI